MINGRTAVCLCACFIWRTVAFSQSTTNNPYHIKVPVRAGVLPNVSTQGKNDKFTTSNFSLNLLGGYTAGVNGLELGGWFNIDKRNMKGLQGAGWFNLVNGDVNGLQVSGLFNGVTNNVTGAQYGGLFNYVKKNMTGMQAAGIANISLGATRGFQVAGIVNYTKHLKGLQVGLINIADTSDGFSIGLLNIVKKGYHKVTISTNEVLNANLAVKSGNKKLYNILMVGINAGSDDKTFSYGYGIGHEMNIAKWFTLNPELTTQYLYLGNWNYLNQLTKFQVLATVKLAHNLALFAGPSFSVYYSDQIEAVKGYKFLVPKNNYHTYNLWRNNVTGWIGWTAGISFL